MKLISIIIPTYNEEKNVALLHAELQKVFAVFTDTYIFETIFVNDGSSDNSWVEIEKLVRLDKLVKGICFSRNFGHQAAIEAGLKTAKGDAVIMMDADLQHPPELIPELIQKWESGFCIVNTKRMKTEKESIFKRVSSRFFYWFINRISDIYLDQGSADFRLLDKKAVAELIKLTEKDKFYRGLIKWIGFRHTIIEYEARKRETGTSSYTLKKMLTLARIGITSFSMLPMKLIMLFGIFLFSIGTILFLVMLYFRWFVDGGFFSGNAILAAIVIISNGFIITVVGILSVYQMTMFKELKNRPSYIIEEDTDHE